MYTNPIESSSIYIHVPITLQQIDSIAQSLNLDFPPFIKEFWLLYNGTSPTRKILGDECVTNFLTLNTLPEEDPRHFDSVELYYKNNRENMEVPDYLLPFASYTNGSPIFVNLLPPNLGYVYLYISHHDKLVLLNTNFVEFINDLRLFDDL